MMPENSVIAPAMRGAGRSTRTNVEVKARCTNLSAIRSILHAEEAHFVGEDHQIDTYFHVPGGRLKLREGIIECHLIYYERPDEEGPKQSDVQLYPPEDAPTLKKLLHRALGVKVVVEKRREIYFIDNVKFHLDRVERLGSFVEIEAIDAEGTVGTKQLRDQCTHYWKRFGLPPEARVAASYSDLLTMSNE